MKTIIVILGFLSSSAFATDITPREWVTFLYQVSQRGKPTVAGKDVAFTLRSVDGESSSTLNLIGVTDGEGGFTPVAVVQVDEARVMQNGRPAQVQFTATQIDLTGEIGEVSGRTMLVGNVVDQPATKPTPAQKEAWARSLAKWRALVATMPDRVGRFDAKETAI